ncbi:hypothetical protein HBN50_04105 [Halobacteriovorax sp. GB3]|uniref:hypothetical protein n=1 Tax=Halobacteriovorax sp. GB3 TaxID=2719615 RepID=UPI002360CAAC|nr:hypothetical protein [Halobacteriovorax sp. GB3]MDD0852264.1 hypothetical protein [Halobacteriovorax sp. GB3]
MMSKFLTTLFILTSIQAMGFENELVLRGGFLASVSKIGTSLETTDQLGGYGLGTMFGYRRKKFELNVSSEIYFGKAEGLKFEYQNDSVQGTGNIRSVSLTPLLKYTTEYMPYKNWNIYFAAGPSWVLQSIELDDFESNGIPVKDHKLTYDSEGGALVIGVEEQTEFKEQHPAFVQLMLAYYRSRKVSLVDRSDRKEIDILSEQDADQDIKTVSLILTIGLVIF